MGSNHHEKDVELLLPVPAIPVRIKTSSESPSYLRILTATKNEIKAPSGPTDLSFDIRFFVFRSDLRFRKRE